jgi:hypothetical protein
LHTTATDFARFLAAVLTTGSEPWRLLPETLNEMLQPHTPVKDQLAWGLGWGLETLSEGQAFWHWGDNPGYKSFVVGLRATGSGVVVMTNADNGRPVCAALVRSVLGTDHPALAWLAARYGDPARSSPNTIEGQRP